MTKIRLSIPQADGTRKPLTLDITETKTHATVTVADSARTPQLPIDGGYQAGVVLTAKDAR